MKAAPYSGVMADQNPGLKLVVLQHVRERRTECLQQSTGINTASGALQPCRQLTSTLETLKPGSQSSAGGYVGKSMQKAKAIFPAAEEQR